MVIFLLVIDKIASYSLNSILGQLKASLWNISLHFLKKFLLLLRANVCEVLFLVKLFPLKLSFFLPTS